MSDAATPVVENKEPNTPTPTPATPAAEPQTPPANEGLVLTFKSKEEKEQFERDAARARTNQSKADRYDRIVGKGGHFAPASQAPATPPTAEELAEKAAGEDRKAERGLLGIAADPKFRAVFDADPTLRETFTKNPLAVLPLLAPDALDAEDALALVTEALEKRGESIKKPETPPADDKNPDGTPKTPPATPPAGGVNVNDTLPNKAAEEALKHVNPEVAVAGSIKERLKAMGGKSS